MSDVLLNITRLTELVTGKFVEMEGKFAKMEGKIDGVSARMAEVERNVGGKLAEIDAGLEIVRREVDRTAGINAKAEAARLDFQCCLYVWGSP